MAATHSGTAHHPAQWRPLVHVHIPVQHPPQLRLTHVYYAPLHSLPNCTWRRTSPHLPQGGWVGKKQQKEVAIIFVSWQFIDK